MSMGQYFETFRADVTGVHQSTAPEDECYGIERLESRPVRQTVILLLHIALTLTCGHLVQSVPVRALCMYAVLYTSSAGNTITIDSFEMHGAARRPQGVCPSMLFRTQHIRPSFEFTGADIGRYAARKSKRPLDRLLKFAKHLAGNLQFVCAGHATHLRFFELYMHASCRKQHSCNGGALA